MWPLGVYWLCFDVKCLAILDLERALESSNSTSIRKVLALCHPLGMEMIWTMVLELDVECRLVGIKFEDIRMYALQFMSNTR